MAKVSDTRHNGHVRKYAESSTDDETLDTVHHDLTRLRESKISRQRHSWPYFKVTVNKHTYYDKDSKYTLTGYQNTSKGHTLAGLSEFAGTRTTKWSLIIASDWSFFSIMFYNAIDFDARLLHISSNCNTCCPWCWIVVSGGPLRNLEYYFERKRTSQKEKSTKNKKQKFTCFAYNASGRTDFARGKF